MYYTIYKTTNLINRKTYIGAHKTNNLEDGYMGSGKHLNRSINKYGIEHFEKEILAVFESSEDMYEVEALIVDEEFVQRKDTYNLKEGGYGGFDYLNNNGLNNANKDWPTIKKKLSEINKGKPNPSASVNLKARHKSGKLDHTYFGSREDDAVFVKQAWTDEACKKRKKTQEKNKFQQGENNSQHGTCWIYNEEFRENKKIKKDDLENWLSENWTPGRVVDFDKFFEKKQIKKQIKKNKELEKLKIEDERKVRAEELFRLYNSHNFSSMRQFVKSTHCELSLNGLSNTWQKYIPEFRNNSKERVPFKR